MEELSYKETLIVKKALSAFAEELIMDEGLTALQRAWHLMRFAQKVFNFTSAQYAFHTTETSVFLVLIITPYDKEWYEFQK